MKKLILITIFVTSGIWSYSQKIDRDSLYELAIDNLNYRLELVLQQNQELQDTLEAQRIRCNMMVNDANMQTQQQKINFELLTKENAEIKEWRKFWRTTSFILAGLLTFQMIR